MSTPQHWVTSPRYKLAQLQVTQKRMGYQILGSFRKKTGSSLSECVSAVSEPAFDSLQRLSSTSSLPRQVCPGGT